MKCKQGDLAIIVKSWAGNEGKIVRLLRFVGEVQGMAFDNRWEIDRHLPTCRGRTVNTFPDAWLRPIRPDSEPTSFESHRELGAA